VNSYEIEKIVKQVMLSLDKRLESALDAVPVGVSARHVHLSKEHFEILFGLNGAMKPVKQLVGGQYACAQQVSIVSGSLKCIEKARVIGPFRDESQVEISRTDARFLDVAAPVRPSGETRETPGVSLVGPCGSVTLKHGLIIANRHIHMPVDLAKRIGRKDGDLVDCLLEGERKTIFCDVQLRVDPSFELEMHIDVDDANAVGLKPSAAARILPRGMKP
jgi:putative phosphotransacetylase